MGVAYKTTLRNPICSYAFSLTFILYSNCYLCADRYCLELYINIKHYTSCVLTSENVWLFNLSYEKLQQLQHYSTELITFFAHVQVKRR